MPITYEIPISAVSKIINAAASAGVKPEELCRASRLDLSALEDADNQIPFTELIRLAEYAAHLTGDDAFGLHVGEQTDVKTYGVLGYVTMNSQTFGEALNRLIRYQQIRTNAVKFSIDITGSDAHLVYHYLITGVLPQERRQESEEMMSTMLQVGRKLTGVDWAVREIHFEHAPPENISEHKRIFRAPIRFKKSLTKLIFDNSILNLPIAEADLTLGSLLELQAKDLLAKSPQHESFAGQVRQLITEGLPVGEARMETVCRKLGNSTRTLQRKLSEEGTSYKKLLEETQRDLSKFYLHKSEMAICEVSYLIGFSQSSAFHRAFRRWTGLTPKEFRTCKSNKRENG
jgi:AraC-like DNA-binding protein